jgi:UDPglucose--hexose-1-phosphate uridylyltransferase
MINAGYELERLLQYALQHRLIEQDDFIAARNALMEQLCISEPYRGELPAQSLSTPIEPLERLVDYAVEAGIIEENTMTHRDLFDTKLMGCLMPRPSEVIKEFYRVMHTSGIQAATDQFYKQCIDSMYIRMDRIQRNLYWVTPTAFGEIEITVNLSKPEKDPREIALLKNAPAIGYPQCLLCIDNVGYPGRLNHPARQNLRVIPLKLDQEDWVMQYSPYVYYNEHCIVLRSEHVPMVLTDRTFERLLDFLEQFPHYFIGSNADLPIVGGSILNHDHFQGGRYVFPEEKAPVIAVFRHAGFSDVRVGIVKWPMSIIRLSSHNRSQLLKLASLILKTWREYTDETVGITAFTQETPHNTITPIARMTSSGDYELDLVLRNNRTNEEHPEGIFHPHRNLHHIKKENIGLIEVMGLAVLPGRLKEELATIAGLLSGDGDLQSIAHDDKHPLFKHWEWIQTLVKQYGVTMTPDQAHARIKDEVGTKFLSVLTDAGVFKWTDDGFAAFERYILSIGCSKT